MTTNLFSLPWNQSTLLGYFGEVFFITATSVPYFTINAAVLILFISISKYHEQFYQMFSTITTGLNYSKGAKHEMETIRDLVNFRVLVQR